MGDITDKQLMVLLTSWNNRLIREIDFARKHIPDSAKKEPEAYFEGKKCSDIPGYQFIFNSPEIYEYKETGDFVALAGLIELSDELEEAMETLKNDKEGI